MSDIEASDTDDFEFESDGEIDVLVDAVDNLEVEDFKVTTLDQIKDSLLVIMRRASDMTSLESGICLLLLNAYNWDLTAMTTTYIDDNDGVARKLGLKTKDEIPLLHAFGTPNNIQEDVEEQLGSSKSSGGKSKSRKSKPSEFVCPICLDPITSVRYSLGCKHFVCKECFTRHVHINTIESRNIFSSYCPGSDKCRLPITRDTVAALVAESELEKYDLLTAQIYVDKMNTSFKYCPYSGCHNIIQKMVASPDSELNGLIAEPVKCACKGVFCYYCGLQADHLAVPCNVATQWLALVDHEHRSTLWISQNTKQCPQCHTKIQRSEGCNHMSCGNCKYQFCWVCSSSWADHSGKSYYNCVKFVSTVSDSTSKSSTSTSTSTSAVSKKQRERLNFYMLRYDNHLSLAGLVENPIAKEAHSLLSWAYVLLCFAVHTNNKILLEELVTDLGRDLEDDSPRLKQRKEALRTFILTTKWVMDPNIKIGI